MQPVTKTKMNFSLVAIGDHVLINDEVKVVKTVETVGDRRSRKKLKVPKFTVCFEGDDIPHTFSWHDTVQVIVLSMDEETDTTQDVAVV